MLVALIVAAEVGCWLLLVSGLAARYVVRRPRLGVVLLAATPVVDLALLAATTIDLRRGGEAAFPHALAPSTPGPRSPGASGWSAGPTLGSRTASAVSRRQHARRAGAASRPLTSAASGFAVSRLGNGYGLLNVAALWAVILAVDFVISFTCTLRPRVGHRAGYEPGRPNLPSSTVGHRAADLPGTRARPSPEYGPDAPVVPRHGRSGTNARLAVMASRDSRSQTGRVIPRKESER